MLVRDKCLWVLIDFQDALLAHIPAAPALVPCAVKLVRVARILDMPIVWTEQYRKGLGPTNQTLASELTHQAPIEKSTFDCFGTPAFTEAVLATGRNQLLLAGVETHVCVMQTALTALERGFEVFVPRDAVASRFTEDYQAGLARMASEGARLGTVEMFIFEALKQAGTPEFKQILPLVKEGR